MHKDRIKSENEVNVAWNFYISLLYDALMEEYNLYMLHISGYGITFIHFSLLKSWNNDLDYLVKISCEFENILSAKSPLCHCVRIVRFGQLVHYQKTSRLMGRNNDLMMTFVKLEQED